MRRPEKQRSLSMGFGSLISILSNVHPQRLREDTKATERPLAATK